MNKEIKQPVSIESGIKQIKEAKAAIDLKRAELEEINKNGFTYTGGLNASDYDSPSELIGALNDIIKEHGDVTFNWRGDLAEYKHPATANEVEAMKRSIESRIAYYQSKIDLISRYVESKMNEAKMMLESI